MKPGPRGAVNRLFEIVAIDAMPRPLVDVLEELCKSEGWFEGGVAREKAEEWEGRVATYIRNELSSLLETGHPVSLAFNSSSEYMIQGSCYIEPTDSDDLKEKKKRRLVYGDYLGALKKLTPKQFENLCGGFIKLLGVKSAIVTRTSADEGIDFYGKLDLDSAFLGHQDLSPTVQKQLSVWLVGQAKHYTQTQSGTPELRELVGSVELAKAKAFGSLDSPLSAMSIRVADPVFMIFMTTGTISINGWRLLDRSGVIGFDGQIIAAFLADRQAGMREGAFDEAAFDEWLNM